MRTVGVRALKQNASAVVAEVSGGSAAIVTDRGRPVAWLVPVPPDRLSGLIAAGLARAPRRRLSDLAAALPRDPQQQPTISEALASQRDDERF